jgi:hypothetical protein
VPNANGCRFHFFDGEIDVAHLTALRHFSANELDVGGAAIAYFGLSLVLRASMAAYLARVAVFCSCAIGRPTMASYILITALAVGGGM